jgi:hypothetical protein
VQNKSERIKKDPHCDRISRGGSSKVSRTSDKFISRKKGSIPIDIESGSPNPRDLYIINEVSEPSKMISSYPNLGVQQMPSNQIAPPVSQRSQNNPKGTLN